MEMRYRFSNYKLWQDRYNFRGHLAPSEAQGGAAPSGWRWGTGASAKKGPMSETTAASKKIEAAEDGLPFL